MTEPLIARNPDPDSRLPYATRSAAGWYSAPRGHLAADEGVVLLPGHHRPVAQRTRDR